MDKTKAHAIVDACQRNGIDAEVFDNYSGRGMYGATTTAVTINEARESEVQRAIDDHREEYFYQFGEEAPVVSDFRTDNLGLGWLIY